MGASLLVFKNKSDVSGAMSETDIREVSPSPSMLLPLLTMITLGLATRGHQDTYMEDHDM